ncbi:DNA alkylation repair protein [Synergistaceae bacterium OttesenSCG-928-I11]|nr:DNA alkylation repair protein [Synergistaceae bacterium OttesenSCG-928-I11]
MKSTAVTVTEKLIRMSGKTTDLSEEKRHIFGMEGLRVLDIPHERLVAFAEEIGMPDQPLATALWQSDLYEARILSCILMDPAALTEPLLDEWAAGITSWVVCDYCCSKAIWKTPLAEKKAVEWAEGKDDWHIYAGFSLIGVLAFRLAADDPNELGFFDRSLFIARKQASQPQVNVSRAISSALKSIGTRSRDWHEAAVETCEEIAMQPSETAKWVASQALGDLLSSEIAKAIRA